MTPAEELASRKQRKRPKRNNGKEPRKVVLSCAVRDRREALNLSLRDVAAGVGLSISGLHAIEYGCDVQMTTALRLCKFFGCQQCDLWTELQQ
jgi:DNA-binding XRE family transcriptional regulator